MERKPLSDEAEVQSAKCKTQNEKTADVSDGDDRPIRESNRRRIARLETLRRIMLILAALLLLGGYAMDVLPVLYASALPLTVALIVTYRIKHLEEAAGKEEEKSKK